KTLANMVQYYKEDPKGVDKMCELMDRIAESRAVEARIETALKMIARGKMTLEEIAEDTGLSLEKVKELAEKRSA
ncbi:MAG: nuclease, partial [Clostridiales bacterium]|nr:nuclease [Clostridiales bacterium]MDY3746017.1 nuclease [Lachnospiraceae bacterium]